MLARLKSLVGIGAPGGEVTHTPDELHLAVAVLLVEAARMDNDFDASERAVIQEIIESRLEVPAEEARELVESADSIAEEMGELWTFARVVKSRFSHDERVDMVEMLWEVAYADGVLHDYEASLLRRITGLLYVSDRDSGLARKRALRNLGITGA